MKNTILRRSMIGIMFGSVFAFSLFQLPSSGGIARRATAHEEERKDQAVKPRIPQSLKLEHDELHAELVKAIKSGGETGAAAEAVAKVLHPHFIKEEEFALPPLGLLPLLAEGKVTPEMKSVLVMTDKLKAEFPEMVREHREIVIALKKLSTAAEREKKPEFVRLAEDLKLHAQTEEDVLYPASILVGEQIRLKLNK